MSRQLRILLLLTLFLFGLQFQNLNAWAEDDTNEEANFDDVEEGAETPLEEPVDEAVEDAPLEAKPTVVESTNSSPKPNVTSQKTVKKQDQAPVYEGDGTVEVEPSHIIPSDLTGNYYLVPYRSRRTTWGFTASLGYSTFEPINYEPEFSPSPVYGDTYHKAETPLIELQFTSKYNMAVGSLYAEFGVGNFVEKSDDDLVDSQLSLTPLRLGLGFILDTLFLEPYVSPYFTVGGYSILYKEKLADTSHNGTTQVAPYFTGGLQFQLDWIDTIAARESYEDSGIESTYIFVEGRKFMASNAAKDPNFETDIHIDAGLKLEF